MVRVATCLPCQKELLETELLDHIERINHADMFRNLSVADYRTWFQTNIIVEDRTVGPYDSPWLRDVKSFGIETRTRHE